MSDTEDLVTWLRTQIAAEKARADEDLRFAEEAGGTWAVHEGGPLNASYLHVDGAEAAMFHGWNHRENLVLAARFNPDAVAERATAVLTQCEAHTALLDLHADRVVASLDLENWAQEFIVCRSCREVGDRQFVQPCPTLRALALAYRRNPGHREEWKP